MKKINIVTVLVWLNILFLGCFIFQSFTKEPDQKKKFGYVFSEEFNEWSKRKFEGTDSDKIETVLRNSVESLRRNALDDDSLIYFALANADKNKTEIDERILSLVRSRNPRNRGVIRAVLLIAEKNNDIPSMIKEATLLYRLDEKNRPEYQDVFTAIYSNFNGRPFVIESLKNTPLWGYQLLLDLINDADANTIIQIESAIEAYISNSDNEIIKRNIISRYSKKLLTFRHYERSFNFWNNQTDEKLIRELIIYNTEFRKLNSKEPFNWKLTSNKAVSTEFIATGGFFGLFRGSAPTTVARQYFPWQQAESVQLKLDASHVYKEGRGGFYIEIRCANTKTLISNFDIEQSMSPGIVLTTVLPVKPINCKMAYLDIVGRPGRFARPITLTVNFLDIVPETSSILGRKE